jgi:hypothetical protein
MSRRFTIVSLLALLLALTLAGGALAEGPTKQVGLVIAFSDGSEHTEIVTVPVAATAFQALQAAAVNLVWADFGFGPAICKINADGCPADDCFCRDDRFWAFYELSGTSWVTSQVGAGQVVPADRAVLGFAWSGFDASYNPTVKPPVYTFAELEGGDEPVAVPEPGTLLLLAGGASGILAYARTRRGRRAG